MDIKTLGNVAAVAAAIAEEAAAQIAAMEQELQAALAAIAAAEVVPTVPPELAARLEAARRAAADRQAADDLEDRRQWLEQRETWFARVVEEGWRRLRRPVEPATRRERLARLAAEAVRALGSDECQLVVGPADRVLLDDAWREHLEQTTGARIVEIVADDTIRDGCIVRSLAGNLMFDNTLEARARRFEGVWRRVLGKRYEQAIAEALHDDRANERAARG